MVPKTAIIIRADWQRVVRGPHLVIRDIVWPKRSFNTFFGGAGGGDGCKMCIYK